MNASAGAESLILTLSIKLSVKSLSLSINPAALLEYVDDLCFLNIFSLSWEISHIPYSNHNSSLFLGTFFYDLGSDYSLFIAEVSESRCSVTLTFQPASRGHTKRLTDFILEVYFRCLRGQENSHRFRPCPYWEEVSW